MKQKAKLAFYKGKGNYIDTAIRKWTNSMYSHVELVYQDYWYSTSPILKGVQKRKLDFNHNHWDFVDIEIEELFLDFYYEMSKGKKYDYLGILLSQVLPLNIDMRNRYFCSEWCSEASKIVPMFEGNKLSPGDLYNKVKGN